MPTPKPTQSPSDESISGVASGARLIKKYPNRRLYDTRSSVYVTLQEVKNFVLAGESLKVVDAKTQEDLTRSIYLQIILEEEAGGVPMFSEATLANIIRVYGHAMQGLMGHYLENNVQQFSNLQKQITEQFQPVSPDAWAQLVTQPGAAMQQMVGEWTQQSNQFLSQMQEQIAKNMGMKK